MTRFIVHSALGMVAAAALAAMPMEAKAQYVASGVGISVGTPGFGLNLAYGQPVVRPAPVVVPSYPVYPVYSPPIGVYGPRPVVVAPAPYWGPYRPGYPHGHYGNYHYPYGRRY